MISLLWLGVLINIFRIFIPSMGTWIVQTFFLKNDTGIKQIREEIKVHRQTQSTISIVDEFAKHARLSRKISALQAQLEKECKLNAESCNKIKTMITSILNCLWVLIVAVAFMNSTAPVVRIPQKWMLPLSYFGYAPWSIGFTSWMTMSYLCIKHVHSALTS